MSGLLPGTVVMLRMFVSVPRGRPRRYCERGYIYLCAVITYSLERVEHGAGGSLRVGREYLTLWLATGWIT